MTKNLIFFLGGKLIKCLRGHDQIKRGGIYKNINGIVQRYTCKTCDCHFSERTEMLSKRGHSYERFRIPKEKQSQAKKLFLDGHEYRDVCAIVGITTATALKLRRLALESGGFNQLPDQYPYCRNVDSSGDLLDKIIAEIPKNLPNEVREEICQDIAVEVLSNRIKIGDIGEKKNVFIRRYYKTAATRRDQVSLDEIIKRDEGGSFTRGDFMEVNVEDGVFEPSVHY